MNYLYIGSNISDLTIIIYNHYRNCMTHFIVKNSNNNKINKMLDVGINRVSDLDKLLLSEAIQCESSKLLLEISSIAIIKEGKPSTPGNRKVDK